MRRFLKYILTIFFTVLAVLFLLDLIYTYTFTHHGIPRNKLSYILSIEDVKYDYIFIGSSRVDNSIVPEIIEEETGKTALNLGVQGATLDDYYLILQLLEEREIEAEKIFVQVDYVYNMEGSSEILKSSLMPYIYEGNISEYIKERDDDFWKLKYVPFYRYMVYDYKLGFREFINTLIGKEPRVDLKTGYNPKYGNSSSEMHYSLPKVINEKNKTISAMNKLAEENKWNLVYFIAPFCSGTENMDYVEKLNKKLYPFWDFSSVFLSKDENFYNCGHLNDLGAREFSMIFSSKLEKENNE